jgi:hypothetical protein
MGANYSAAVWPGNGAERARWAVLCRQSACYYFPAAYGQRAAERLARRMNERA